MDFFYLVDNTPGKEKNIRRTSWSGSRLPTWTGR